MQYGPCMTAEEKVAVLRAALTEISHRKAKYTSSRDAIKEIRLVAMKALEETEPAGEANKEV